MNAPRRIPAVVPLMATLLFVSCDTQSAPGGDADTGVTGADGVRLVLDEADAALAILETPGKPSAEAWERLVESEGYRRLHQREAAMGRAFTDSSFRAFLTGDSLRAHAAALRATVDGWRGADISAAAGRAQRYLPPGAELRARLYPVIKPRTNSFVFELNTDSAAIFMFVDPAVSPAEFENTLAHELHHVGLAAACRDDDAAVVTDSAAAAVRRWVGAFGEGIAMLAAAGGADVHPHASSDPPERSRWDRDYASAAADLERIQQFFEDVLAGRTTGDAVTERAMTFFGDAQGPWYTVGYLMATTIEREQGRDALLSTLCEPVGMLEAYNAAAAAYNARGGAALPLWSESLVARLR
jgi:hypothetical protein